MTNCKLCKQKIEGVALSMSKGTICQKCASDINLAETQPLMSHNTVLWVLAETFFRRGKGEDVTFEQVWNKNKDGLILVKFEELMPRSLKTK